MHKVLLPILLCYFSFSASIIEVTPLSDHASELAKDPSRTDRTFVDLLLIREASREAGKTAQTLAEQRWPPVRTTRRRALQPHRNINKINRADLPTSLSSKSGLDLYSPIAENDRLRRKYEAAGRPAEHGGRQIYDTGKNSFSYGIVRDQRSSPSYHQVDNVLPKRQLRSGESSPANSADDGSSHLRQTRAGRQYDVPQIRKYSLLYVF